MLAQHGYIIVALVIVGALAYNWMNNNNIANDAQNALQVCKDQVLTLYEQGVCKGSLPVAAVKNVTLNTGGAIQ